MTPHELLAAYQKATGFEVTLSQSRQMSLTSLVLMGATPEDVFAVVAKLKYHMKQKPNIYPPECLEFRRVMGDPDKFEERMLSCRAERLRKRPPQPQVERESVNGIRVLDDPPKQDVPSLNVAQALHGLANQLRA